MKIELLERLNKQLTQQPDKPEETPESTLRALYYLAKGERVSAVKATSLPLPELNQDEYDNLVSLVEQRCAGIPLAYLTGRQTFMGIEMLSEPQALIPRKETELLAYESLSIVRSLLKAGEPATMIDVCTGSGNVVLGIVAHEPGCRAFGSDLSPEAVKLACDNAVFMGLDNKVEFRVGDLFEPYFSNEFFGKVDLISCNPPYISSRKVPELNPEISDYEPHMAFDGGPHGINIMRRLINESPQFLRSRSFLCFEVGLGQGGIVERMLRNSNQYDEIRPLADDNSNVGAFIARTNR